MGLKTYDITEAEKTAIAEVNGPPKNYKCFCAIHATKPSWCKQGPLVSTRMPMCGYYFENGERKGECKNCGWGCFLPRKDGSEYGFVDPNGKPCRHLIVKEV